MVGLLGGCGGGEHADDGADWKGTYGEGAADPEAVACVCDFVRPAVEARPLCVYGVEWGESLRSHIRRGLVPPSPVAGVWAWSAAHLDE